jgi:hypothetical protein
MNQRGGDSLVLSQSVILGTAHTHTGLAERERRWLDYFDNLQDRLPFLFGSLFDYFLRRERERVDLYFSFICAYQSFLNKAWSAGGLCLELVYDYAIEYTLT